MANKYYLRTPAQLTDLSTIDDVVKTVRQILTDYADSPDVISGGIHIHPTTVIPGDTPIQWSRPYASPAGQAAPAAEAAKPDQGSTQGTGFQPTHRNKKTGVLVRLVCLATHTPDDEQLAVYQEEFELYRARPSAEFKNLFEELADNG